MRARFAACAAAAAGLVAASILGTGAAPVSAAPVQPLTARDCKVKQGQPLGDLWAQRRLAIGPFGRSSSITSGLDVDTGRPVRVAVLDSGLFRGHPQMRGIDGPPRPQDAINKDPGPGQYDCVGHGTQVTAIIAAQPQAGVAFAGVAPRARILPIKLTNSQDVQALDIARAIDIAIADKAQIANMSLGIPVDVPALRDAVGRAAQHHLLIVAAAGNDGQNSNLPQYPAAYSTTFSNVIAVSSTDNKDQPAKTSESGNFVNIAAPGDGVQTIGVRGGYLPVTGTSFATPFVTGTAALVLAANPGLTPAQIRARIQATADPPPATVPSPQYGRGIVNPYLAITSVRDDAHTATRSSAPAPLGLGQAPPAPDRHLRNVALGAGLGLLGLAALAITGAAVLRGNRTRTGRAAAR